MSDNDFLDKEIKEEVRISPRTGKPVKSIRSNSRFGKKRKMPNKRGNGKNSPVIGMTGYRLNESDNAKLMEINLALFNMERIDMYNAEEVAKRLGEYFELYGKYDFKPTVAGMALCLNGMSRHTLYNITRNVPVGGDGYKTSLPQDVATVIKTAYFLLENMWETYMNSGKINPVSGIFLGKNNYGYKDKTEHVVTPEKNTEDFSVEEIKSRYTDDQIPENTEK